MKSLTTETINDKVNCN